MKYCIEVSGMSVAYDAAPILTNVEWKVPCGTLAAVIGPNGGGKSTLLRTLVGRLQPTAGTVRILGKQPRDARPAFAYLPQNEEIDWRFPIRAVDVVLQGKLHHEPWWRLRFPWSPRVSATEAGSATRRATGAGQSTRGADGAGQSTRGADEALAALRRVDLEHKAWQPVGELSGGQRQRVLLAKALIQDARLILLDEPATALDATAQHDLLDILEELKDEGRTIVATTHDLNCLADHFDSVLGIRRRVIDEGPPEEVLTPEFLLNLFGQHTPLLTDEGRVTMVEHVRHGDDGW